MTFISKGNSCGKNLLCLSLSLGVVEKISYFLFTTTSLPTIANMVKTRCHKLVWGEAVQYVPMDLLINSI